MTSQFEWIDPRPPKPTDRPYTDFQLDHDQNPLRTTDGVLLGAHGGRVPGVRRAHRLVHNGRLTTGGASS